MTFGDRTGRPPRARPRVSLRLLAGGALALVAVLATALVAGARWGDAAGPSVTLTPAFGGRVFESAIDLVPLTEETVLIAERSGRVHAVRRNGNSLVVLDIAERLASGHEELGLLSIAPDPAFEANGALWTYYMAPSPLRGVISRFTVDRTTGSADPASELVALEIPQPFPNHNGGALRFGPDGMLYLGIGDGGDAEDPLDSGQDRGTLLGSVIRIDVSEPSARTPYRVPQDNPFVEDANARPEIWAYGLRNPWRMAFDPVTGALWAGDVGQYAVEEVDVVTAGGNYGWSDVEGDRCFRDGCDRAASVSPVATYSHDEGCSITGGAVYRGRAIADLVGSYVFGDLCTGVIWALDATDRSRRYRIAQTEAPLVSFGTDAAGELYVLRFGAPILRLDAAR